jgi:hypothetical protein
MPARMHADDRRANLWQRVFCGQLPPAVSRGGSRPRRQDTRGSLFPVSGVCRITQPIARLAGAITGGVFSSVLAAVTHPDLPPSSPARWLRYP